MSHIYRGSEPNIYIGNPIYCHLRCAMQEKDKDVPEEVGSGG